MKALVLGAGNIGSAAAQDLADTMPSTEITVADKDEDHAKDTAAKIAKDNVSWRQIDATKNQQLVSALKEYDLAMGFLPGNLGYSLMKTCIRAQTNLVDVSYTAENPLRLHQAARKANITIIPDCGLAPGISNILVGHAATQLDEIITVHIMVGGLPESRTPPLNYIITWSPESLIDEYTRDAVIIEKRKKTRVKALSGLETIDFPKIGKLEAFFTDGLRTLTHSIENPEEMWEKTLRYVGHAEKIRLLNDLGFFEEKRIRIGTSQITPRSLTAKLFSQKLHKPNMKDIVALKIEVTGLKHKTESKFTYHLVDRYDQRSCTTAMARTTAFPAAIAAKIILEGAFTKKGIMPPEELGKNDKVFDLFMKELASRRIQISEEHQTMRPLRRQTSKDTDATSI